MILIDEKLINIIDGVRSISVSMTGAVHIKPMYACSPCMFYTVFAGL